MGDLSERDVEDVLGGVQPPGRDDLAPVVELTTWLHVSREIEPPPAMRDDLFCQIEDGLRVYQRSSRRAPAHLRRPRTSTRGFVRERLAGSRRPIASVAAAAVLLVGVILAVRAGGPGHEPSAFVSPSAGGFPATGADAPATTTTTAAPTTTVPPTTASDPTPAGAGPTVTQSERGTTASTDTTTVAAQSGDADATTPMTEKRRGEREDDGASASSEAGVSGGRTQQPPSSGASDDTAWWDLPLSGWDFDLSELRAAKDLWAAWEQAQKGDEPVDPEGVGPSGDDEHDDGRYEDGEGERGVDEDGVSEYGDVGDTERER
jgi:hypothetical protein